MLQTKTSKNNFKNIHDFYMNHRYKIIMSHLKNKKKTNTFVKVCFRFFV